jgi:GNAT superfamily N-acetyltransferase
MEIVPLQSAHLPDVSVLCAQLGYPIEQELLRERLPALAAHPDHRLLVAVEGRAVGWGHGLVETTLITGSRLVVAALVVDETCRSRGVGAHLLSEIEAWGKARGCLLAHVSSRLTRERAHAFYLRQGYAREKTSEIFRKLLWSL